MELIYLLISSSHLSLSYGNDYLFWQWFCGLTLCAIPISFFIGKRLGLASGILFFMTIAHSVSVAYNQFNQYIGEWAQVKQDMAVNSPLSAMSAMILVLSMVCLGERRKKLLDVIGVFTTINALIVVGWWLSGIKKYNGGYGFSGLLSDAGMNACLMAIGGGYLIPEKIKSWKALALPLAGTALLLSNGAVGIGAFALVVLSYGIMKNKKLLWSIPVIAAIAVVVTGLSNFTDSSGRFAAYGVFMSDWTKGSMWSLLFGYGPGAFPTLSYSIQKSYGFMTDFRWAWLHSDWLELLWSHGVAGLFLAIEVYAISIYRVYKSGDARLFSLLVAIGGVGAFNYPLRLFPTAAIATLAVVEGLSRAKEAE